MRTDSSSCSSTSIKRYHQALALMGATRPASGFLKQRLPDSSVISTIWELLFSAIFPDAGRVSPISVCAFKDGNVLQYRLSTHKMKRDFRLYCADFHRVALCRQLCTLYVHPAPPCTACTALICTQHIGTCASAL
jgi:hypothetical protein